MIMSEMPWEQKPMLTGGCLCGRVRYQAAATPFHETMCHCSMCRRAAGAPVVAWFSVPRSTFRVLAGEITHFQSSKSCVRGFCATCGTSLTFASEDFPDELDVTTCSLDDPAALPPRDHVHTRSKLPWISVGDGLAQYPQARDGR
jgi:hypothetical protein